MPPSRTVLGFAPALFVACTLGTVPAPDNPSAPSVDIVEPDQGVPDRGDDPGVVAIEDGEPTPCSGVLVAADAVLTSLRCAAGPGLSCSGKAAGPGTASLPAPSSLRVFVGGDMPSAVERGRARAIVAPAVNDPCSAEIAVLLLDEPIYDIQPVAVRSTGAALGDRLRTVSFQPAPADGVFTRFLRDHVPVVATTLVELQVMETGCSGGCGGPALSESTGEVVGIAFRPLTGTAAASDEYARADAFIDVVQRALAQSTAAASSGTSETRQSALKGPADMGANCVVGSDCAAGACVTDGPQRYCTRRCDPNDVCPAHFRCEDTMQGQTVCIET